jgi:hypothetical protein
MNALRINYYANGDWIGGAYHTKPRAARYAINTFKSNNYTKPYVYRYQSGHGHGMSIQLSDGITRYCITIEPTGR